MKITEDKDEKRRAHLNRHKIQVDGGRLTAARIAAGLTQEQVSDALNCTRSYIGKWETGWLFPNEERVFKLVKLYGTMNFVRINSSDSEENN